MDPRSLATRTGPLHASIDNYRDMSIAIRRTPGAKLETVSSAIIAIGAALAAAFSEYMQASTCSILAALLARFLAR